MSCTRKLCGGIICAQAYSGLIEAAVNFKTTIFEPATNCDVSLKMAHRDEFEAYPARLIKQQGSIRVNVGHKQNDLL